MPKTLKIILIALAALLALLLLAAAIAVTAVDPNDYKPLLIRTVQEKTQRTLNIPGDIKLGVFPNLALELGQASLSARNSDARFASVDSARLSLELLPLLLKKVVVDKVRISGLRADIVRFKEGGTNYDDLLSGGEGGGGQQVLFDIDSIRVSDAQLVYDDRQQDRRLEIARFNMETGRIANRVPGKLQLSADVKSNRPAVDAHVALGTGFTLDIGDKHYVLSGVDAEVKGALPGFSDLTLKAAGDADLKPEARQFALNGIKLSADGKHGQQAFTASMTLPSLAVTDRQVNGGKLSGEAKLLAGKQTMNAGLSIPAFQGSPQDFSIPAFALDTTIRDGELDANARLSGALNGNIDTLLLTSPQLTLALQGKQGDSAIGGTLTTPLEAALQDVAIKLPKIVADFTLPNPGGGTMALKASGAASADLGRQAASALLNGKLDQSTFDAKLGLKGFTPLAYTFDIGIDQLDLDRYRSKPVQQTKGAAPPAGPAPAQAAATPIDLSALQDLRADGKLRIGKLKAANIKSTNLHVNLHAANGKLEAVPLSADLYEGKLTGALSAAAGQPARIAVRQTLTGVRVGPLLQDAIGKQPVEGKGNVRIDVAAAGDSADQWMKSLDGSARLELRDGAVRGVNIAQAVRSAKAKIGELRGNEAPQGGTASAVEKTDFSELTASFRIAKGVARNDDLLIKSPLARVTGNGDIDLGAQRVDYLVRATIVSTLQGQGGPELQALKGLTVPVRLAGPFDAIDWRVDFSGIAGEMAKQKIEEKKEDLKAKAKESLGEEKSKLQNQLKDQLKGLFKR